MPVDGGGNVTRPSSPIPVTGQGADAPQVNVPINDIYNIMNMFPFLDGRKSWRGNQNLNGYRFTGAANAVGQQDFVTLSQMQAAISQIETPFFAGFMQVDTATSTAAPAGWLYANGQSVSRNTYSRLWARVSAGNNLAATQAAKTNGQYGPGNGTSTFTLPNLYADGGYFIRPMGTGRTIGSVQTQAIQSHGHTASFSGNALPPHTHSGDFLRGDGGGATVTGGGSWVNRGIPSASAGTPTGSVTVNSTGGTETRPQNIAYPVLIKT